MFRAIFSSISAATSRALGQRAYELQGTHSSPHRPWAHVFARQSIDHQSSTNDSCTGTTISSRPIKGLEAPGLVSRKPKFTKARLSAFATTIPIFTLFMIVAAASAGTAVAAPGVAGDGPGWALTAVSYPTNFSPTPATSPGVSGTIAIDVFNVGSSAAGCTNVLTTAK